MVRPIKIDHVAIAVNSIVEVQDFFAKLFPIERSEIREWDGERDAFRGTSFMVGDSKLELLEPVHPNGFVQRFLQRNGEGVHHINIQVDDLEAMARKLQELDVPYFSRSPGPPLREIFIHPRNAHGVLLQFIEPKSADSSS